MAQFDPDAYLAKKEKEKKKEFDPDAYLKKTQPESALQTFGRSTASMADSALNLVTGALDVPARAMARAYYGGVQGMPLAQAEERAIAETTSPKDVVGRAFGVAGTQGYEQAPLRQLGTAIGETVGENVIQPIASATGLPESYVGDVAGMLPIPGAQPAVRAIQATGRGAVNTVRGAVDIGQGVYGGFTGDIARPGACPRPGQQASARQPVGETYIPQEELARWRAGQVETPNLQTRPTSELPQAALARTGGTVPFEGQGLRAFGEQLGQDYRNPYKLIPEIAGDILLGGAPTAARFGIKAVQGIRGARAANELSKYGFTPLTAAEQAALKSGKPYPGNNASGPVSPASIPIPPAPTQPQLGYSPTPTPTVINMPGPGRRVNIEGESFNLPYQIDTSNVQTAGPTMRPVSPAVVAQQMAAEKITPPTTPLQAIAQETVAQKAQRVMGDRYRAPVNEQLVAPVAPTPVAPTPVAPTPVAPTPIAAAATPVAVTPVATTGVNTPALKGLGMNTEPALAEKMSRVLPDEEFNRYSYFTPEQQQLIEKYDNSYGATEKLKLAPQIEQLFGNVSAVEHPYRPGTPIGLPKTDPKLEDMYNRIQATKVVKNQSTSFDYNVLTPAEVKEHYIKNYGTSEATPKLKKGQTEEQYWNDPFKKQTAGNSIISKVENNMTSPTSLAVSQFKNSRYGTNSLPLSEAQADTIRSSTPSYTIHYRPTNMPEFTNRAKQLAEVGNIYASAKTGPVIREQKGNVRVPDIKDKKFNDILDKLGGKDSFNIKKDYQVGAGYTLGEEWVKPATATTPTYRLQLIESKKTLGTDGFKIIEGDTPMNGKEIARVNPVEPKPKTYPKKKE